MKNTKLLCLLILITIFISCGNNPETDTDNVTNEKEIDETEITTVEDRSELDDLDEFDFDGYVFNMLSEVSAYYNGLLNVEEELGEIINDAIYRRNRKIEDRFNIVFSEIYNDQGSILNIAKNSIIAGDNEYDIIRIHLTRSIPMVQEGLLHSAKALPHIDLSKSYWLQDMNEALTVAGQLYLVTGAYDTSVYDYTHMWLFNKQIINDLMLESPYDIIRAGAWTFDKYAELAVAATIDLNGDGAFDGEDRYGMVARNNILLPSFWAGAGLTTVEIDSDGEPFLNVGSEKFIEVIDKAFQITWDNDSWYKKSGANQADSDKMFADGKGLFLESSFYFTGLMRSMETDFGIIPFPKYTEDQEYYYSWTSATPVVIPITADSIALERTSVMLETLSCESLQTVVPAMYDVALKVRNTRDTESEEMIDLIFAHRLFDYGISIWDSQIRNGIFSPMFANNDRNLVSKIAALENTVQKLSGDMVAAFKELE